MPLFTKGEAGIAPVSLVRSFPAAEFNSQGPYLIVAEFWCHTQDALAGTLNCNINWLDAQGKTRLMEAGGSGGAQPVTLFDDQDRKFIYAQLINRQSATSQLEFETILSGIAGSALWSYNIMVRPPSASGVQTWSW